MKVCRAILVVLVLSSFCMAALPDPVIYLPFDGDAYPDTFDNAGTAVPDTVSSLTTFNDIQPLRAPDSGIRGGCLDLTAATMGGTAGVARYGSVGALDDTPMEMALDNIKSFTICGWYNTKSLGPIGANARLFTRVNYNNPGGGNAIMLYAPYDSRLTLWVDEGYVHAPAYQYGQADKWAFFAVSYDGTQTTDNVNFYVGLGEADPNAVTHVGGTAVTLNQGTVDRGVNHPMIICNQGYTETSAVRSFSGLFDEFRIYASKDDASGALTYAQVKEVKELAYGAFCGDSEHQPPVGDLTRDCIVDLADFLRMASHWLEDTRP